MINFLEDRISLNRELNSKRLEFSYAYKNTFLPTYHRIHIPPPAGISEMFIEAFTALMIFLNNTYFLFNSINFIFFIDTK